MVVYKVVGKVFLGVGTSVPERNKCFQKERMCKNENGYEEYDCRIYGSYHGYGIYALY